MALSLCGGPDWRRAFGDLWSQLALGDHVERPGDPRRVGARATVCFEIMHRDLLGLWDAPGGSRGSVLRCAAMALECSARVWQAFGPAAGHRHLHLLHRLEDVLADAERRIRAAEAPLLVRRSAVSVAGRAARAAIDDLLGNQGDRAQALAALEDAAVDVAALAVRIALNLNEIGGARRGYGERPAALEGHLKALASEVKAVAGVQRSAREEDGSENHAGVWLSAAVAIAPPADAIEVADHGSRDPCLRSDALCSLRGRWLELAVALWVLVQELDALLAIPTFGGEGRLERALSLRAGSALLAGDLCRRPGDFDHQEAWRRQREALYELVRDVCLALQTGEADAVVRSQELALRRLARALAAMWAIDERVRLPVQGSSG